MLCVKMCDKWVVLSCQLTILHIAPLIECNKTIIATTAPPCGCLQYISCSSSPCYGICILNVFIWHRCMTRNMLLHCTVPGICMFCRKKSHSESQLRLAEILSHIRTQDNRKQKPVTHYLHLCVRTPQMIPCGTHLNKLQFFPL